MVFVFFLFNKSPVFFNPLVLEELRNSPAADSLARIETSYSNIFENKKNLALQKDIDQVAFGKLQAEEKNLRNEVKSLIKTHLPNKENNDKDYVFINFVLTHLPKGVIGLLLAMILCAAMSSTSSEISALASSSIMDLYKPNVQAKKNDNHYLLATKIMTLIWGLLAIGFACFASLFENLIQFVNIIGSLFYGTMLGIFLVGFILKKVGANAVFYAALIAELAVILIYKNLEIGYLWLNLIGATLVILFSLIFRYLIQKGSTM
jgi:Na+/proline symporter